jgi:hypothetical protein
MKHPDNQRDSEKKPERHSKALGEKRPNPGSFWFTAKGGSFFQRHKKLGVASLVSELKENVHKKPVPCVFAYLVHSSRDTGAMHHPQASKQALANNTYWRLACVADSVGTTTALCDQD